MTCEHTIAFLADARDKIPVLARLFVNEWPPYYGPDGPGDAAADLEECRNVDAVPFALIALDEESTVLGTAALKSNSVGDDVCEGPWLSAMVVAPDHRGLGCGTALVAAVEQHAKQLGIPAIACSTDAGKGILQQRGWSHVGQSESLRGSVPVYRLAFDAD